MAKIGNVQEVPLTELIPYENNAKQHSAEQIEKIANSIKEFGFLNPVLIDKDHNIIAGHGRVLAMKRLGMENVPCLFVEGLTEAQKRAYILADNRLTELGEWDMNLVNEELNALLEEGFDIDLTGFDLEEEPEEDEEEERPEVEFTEVLGEEHNYIVLYFDNEVDWLQAESLFDIEPKKNLSTRHDGVITESMQRVSVGRVLNGAKALERLRAHYEDFH